ncbi:MAG: ATP-binding protein, partial [Gammaproteobacteria bacterium]
AAESREPDSVRTLETLYRLADRVSRARGLTDVCEAAIEATVAVAADRASVLVFDDAGVMRFCAWQNLSDAYRAAVDGHSPWSPDAVDPAPIVVADVGVEPALAALRDVIAAEGIRALAFVPLVHNGRLLGKFMTYYDAPHVFSEGEIRLASTIAQHVAVGIARVRAEAAIEEVLGHARRQQREAELVAELAQRMNASLDLPTTLERLVEGARELCDADIARIVVRDPATGRMRLRHVVGTRWRGYHDGIAIEAGHGSGGIVLMTGKPFLTADYVNDPRITPDYRAAALEDGTIAQIVVPIPGEATLGGLLYVDRCQPRPFTPRDEAVLLRLADHAATAIRNSQLFAAEQAARAEADAANRAKDRFLAVLSHELRTPLNAILGWARLARNPRLPESERHRGLEVIERNAQVQAQLVADLLDVSRIVAGKIDIERVLVDLVFVARQAIEAVTADLDAKQLRLDVALDASVGEVLGDPIRLQQVVSNLLSNAIKFTPARGHIDLRLARKASTACLTIADSGEGIEPDLLERIFDPFEQADSSTTRKHRGLGLGLAIVRQLVELHGGAIRAESAGKGRGAT